MNEIKSGELCWVKQRVFIDNRGKRRLGFIGTGEIYHSYTYTRKYPTPMRWYEEAKYSAAREWVYAATNTGVEIGMGVMEIEDA